TIRAQSCLSRCSCEPPVFQGDVCNRVLFARLAQTRRPPLSVVSSHRFVTLGVPSPQGGGRMQVRLGLLVDSRSPTQDLKNDVSRADGAAIATSSWSLIASRHLKR